MARIRTIKPGLFRHEKLYKLEKKTGLPIRIAFAGLFTAADREGRFKWRPGELKLDVLPYDLEVDFSRVLDALAAEGFLQKYEVDGAEYGCIPTWRLHQVINNRESKSTIPPVDSAGANKLSVTYDFGNLPTREARVEDASATRLVHAQGEGKGRGREKEGKGTGAPADASVVAIAPTRKNDSQLLVEHWKTEFTRVYRTEPTPMPAAWRAAKTIITAVGFEHAKLLVSAFFEMKDQWFVTKRHSLLVLQENVDAVNIYLGTGETFTRLQIRQQEQHQTYQSQLNRIEKGLL